ncbi:MAG: amidohydrolase family protein [Bacteroidales bacterium]|nr:amidohydrolase family protein [Bacteroidales bacterium]
MKKIDAHLHVNFEDFDPETIIEYLDDHQIEKCWLLTWEEMNPPVPSLYQHISAEDVFEVYSRYPDRIIPFYAPDPKSKSLSGDLEKYMKLGLKGCGELKVAYSWYDEAMEEYLKIISDLKLPLVFHMEAPGIRYVTENHRNPLERTFGFLMNGAFNGVARYYINKFAQKTNLFSSRISSNSICIPGYLHDFNQLEKKIAKHPKLTFVGHGPHFWNNISSDISDRYFYQRGPVKDFGIIDLLLEKYDNFYCDVSGRSGYYALNRDVEQSKRFLEKHSDKVLFGTDNVMHGKLENLILSWDLSRQKLQQIFHENAERIIG